MIPFNDLLCTVFVNDPVARCIGAFYEFISCIANTPTWAAAILHNLIANSLKRSRAAFFGDVVKQ